MNGQGIHHMYVETHDWAASLQYYEALGFTLAPGFEGCDVILQPAIAGPYVFLREVPATQPLEEYVVFGADDLGLLAKAPGVAVAREPYEQHWGPIWMDTRDPDGRVRSVREQEK